MIEIKGIIQYRNAGHKYVEVVVDVDSNVPHVVHKVGVDIKVNKGNIQKYLAELYRVSTSKIAWPDQIKAVDIDIIV